MRTALAVLILAAIALFLAVPATGALAQTPTGGNPTNPPTGGNPGTTLINPLKSGTSLEGLLNSILDFVIRIGTVAIILMIVYVGFKFVTARGNPGEIEAAKKALLWTVIGALILLGAKAISVGLQATVSALGG